jgi:hypothetical protein
VIATEYPAHVAAVPIASRSPFTSPETPPLPSVTSATPANEQPAASQNDDGSRSRPTRNANNPTKIGVVPRISATVDAVVRRSEYT